MSSITMAESWPLDQLIKLRRTQPHLVQRALQRLFEEDDEVAWAVVVNAYLDEEISLARTAALLDIHPLELRERFLEKGIPLRLGPASTADAQAEIDAIRTWKRKAGD